MRTLLLTLVTAIVLVGCQQNQEPQAKAEVRYTQQSAEIETYKSMIRAYENGDWDGYRASYSDTVSIFRNDPDKAYKPDETIAIFKEQTQVFSSYGFDQEGEEYEMVKTDDGNTWVNYWGVWKATIAANGQEVKVPVHLTAQFVDGKVAREYGYWDNAIVNTAMEALEAEGEEEGSEEGSE